MELDSQKTAKWSCESVMIVEFFYFGLTLPIDKTTRKTKEMEETILNTFRVILPILYECSVPVYIIRFIWTY